tara:strand:+ start:1700 stop:1810 length:111 start_codon:yes stop_codon:yes gene_type:complete
MRPLAQFGQIGTDVARRDLPCVQRLSKVTLLIVTEN